MTAKPPILASIKIRLILRILAVVVLCGLWGSSDLAFAWKQNTGTQFLGMLGDAAWLLAFIISIIFLRPDWRRVRYWALVAPLVCLGSCVGIREAGTAVRRAQFEQRLPRYEALISKMESGAIPISSEVQPVTLSDADRDLGYSVLAHRGTNGVLTVEFMTGGGFPVVHSGYLYVSSGVVEPGSVFDSRWPMKWQIRPKWFKILD